MKNEIPRNEIINILVACLLELYYSLLLLAVGWVSDNRIIILIRPFGARS